MSVHDQFLQGVLGVFQTGQIGEVEVTFSPEGEMTVTLSREQKVVYIPQDPTQVHYGREARRPSLQQAVEQAGQVPVDEDATRAHRLPVQERPSGGR